MLALEQLNLQSSLIDQFCNFKIFDKKFAKSSDLDLNLRLDLTALYNYDYLLPNEQKEFISLNLLWVIMYTKQ